MVENFQLKNFDDVVMGFDYNYHFPTTNNFALPFTLFDTKLKFIKFIAIYSLSLFIPFAIGFSYFLANTHLQGYALLIAIFLAVSISLITFHTLFSKSKFKIETNQITLPISLFGKIKTIEFSRIYDIYFTQNNLSNNRKRNLINIHYLTNINDYNSREKLEFEMGCNEDETRKITAIARTAMLNYHQKHNITNLPNVKFIQQK